VNGLLHASQPSFAGNMMQDLTRRRDSSGSDGAGSSDEAGGTERFAFVIPVYNHGGTVRTVVTKAMDLGYPVIVVNDGSDDSTEAEAPASQSPTYPEEVASKPNIRL